MNTNNSDIPDELNLKVRQDLAEQGMEMIPEEVRHHRAEACRKIREALRVRGWIITTSPQRLGSGNSEGRSI